MFLFLYLREWAIWRTIDVYTVLKTSHLWLATTLTHMNGFWYFLAEIYR